MPAENLTSELVRHNLKTKRVGSAVHCFDSIDSTNRQARQYAGAGALDGTVVLAEYQSGGRGRLDRSWLAPAHSNLLCSIILYPAVDPEYLFRLTMLASIAVVDALQSATGIRAGIKWPNDVYVGSKKICGILTEIDCEDGKVLYAVVGIGLNVNWSLMGTELESSATSVQDILGRQSSRLGILQQLMQQLDLRYEQLHNLDLLQQWEQRCMHMGKKVQIHSGTEMLEGNARGITEKGHLLLDCLDGRREILCGDVSLRW